MYGLVLSAECSARRSARPGKQLPARVPHPPLRHKRATGRIQTTTNTPRQFLSRLAGRVTGVRRRRGETNGARRDRRGFGCRKRWNCSCSFSGDSECYGGWPQASYGIRIDRGLAVVLQSCRAGIFLGKTRERILALAALLAGGVWGMSPCLFDCGDRGGANYQRVP